MAMPDLTRSLFITLVIFLGFMSGSYAGKFRMTNECINTVWPAIVGSMLLPITTTTITIGFALPPGKSYTVTIPTSEVKIWVRTLCSDSIAGNFSCVTGDCNSSNIDCRGGNTNPNPPVTLAEFTLNGSDGLDYYKVSLTEGFNLPMRIEPGGRTGAGSCRATGCGRDLNKKCPTKLKVIKDGGDVVGCQSLCQVHETCKSTLFSEFSKSICPEAYQHGSFTCASAQYYTLTFCPTSSKSSKNKEKKSPVENSGGHVGSSHYVLKLFIKNVMPFVAVAVSFLITFTCVCFACRTWYRSPNRQWGTEMVVGRTSTTAETLARNPQHVNVEMVNS